MTAKSISRPRRSILFVSALGQGALTGAIKSGADIICVDLEDAVPPARKADGRVAAQTALQEGPREAEVQIAVRINSLVPGTASPTSWRAWSFGDPELER